MPVPVRDTPLGRELYEEGRRAGRRRSRRESELLGERRGERSVVPRLTALMLRQRFGDDHRIPAIAEELAELPDVERLDRIAAATDLADLTSD